LYQRQPWGWRLRAAGLFPFPASHEGALKHPILGTFQDAKRKGYFRFAAFSSAWALENSGTSPCRTGAWEFFRVPHGLIRSL
jgi:hypothetical protein